MRRVCVLRRAQLCETPWTVAHQAPLSTGCPRQESWSGLPFPSPGDLPDPSTELPCLALAGKFFTTELPGKPIPSTRFSFSSSSQSRLIVTKWPLLSSYHPRIPAFTVEFHAVGRRVERRISPPHGKRCVILLLGSFPEALAAYVPLSSTCKGSWRL